MNAIKTVSVLGFGYFFSVLYMAVHQTDTESGSIDTLVECERIHRQIAARYISSPDKTEVRWCDLYRDGAGSQMVVKYDTPVRKGIKYHAIFRNAGSSDCIGSISWAYTDNVESNIELIDSPTVCISNNG